MFPLVHPDALHFSTPVRSYWEASASPLAVDLQPLTTDTTCEVAIIGGGFTGLSAALELAESGVDVCLLEAGPIGWGASGRNGGFACIGSHKLPYATMIRRYGLAETQAFYTTMRDSVDLVADNAARLNINIWKQGEGEVTLAHAPDRLAALAEDQAFYKSTFGEHNDLLQVADLKQQGLYGPHFYGGLRGTIGFGIHPLNYVRGLARAAHGAGARLYPQSKLMRWQQQGDVHHLYTDHAMVSARKVIVATNGYTPEHLSPHHKGRILPALSNIIVTRPLTQAELQAQGWTSDTMAYDSRNLLHYFRLLPDKRFLFGGRGGTDASNTAAPAYRAHLTQTFHHLFPAWAKADITHFWRGFVCLAYDRVPYVGPLDGQKSVWTALAYHGNGVAMGTWCGRAVARMIAGKSDNLPKVITRRLAKFPLPAFRPLYLKGAYVWYGWQDARSVNSPA
jgi:glycine/D-amino acid oxidase-like deaminating enzyme